MMSPGGPYELKIEGNGSVRRFFSAFTKEEGEDTPAIRRIAPRNVSLIFIKLFSKKMNVGTAALSCPSSAARHLCLRLARRRECMSPLLSWHSKRKPRRSGASFKSISLYLAVLNTHSNAATEAINR